MIKPITRRFGHLAAKIRILLRRDYYYLDRDEQLRVVKHLLAKCALGCSLAILAGLPLIFLLNDLAGDVLGVGYGRLAGLRHENQVLEERVTELDSRVQALEPSINQLNDQGNRLRLLVDLPKLDGATTSGGTGGAAVAPMAAATGDNAAQILQSTSATLQRLVGQLQVQEQSYQQIEKKYQYNRLYFASLPALKPMDGPYSVDDFGLRMHPILGVLKSHEGLDIINDVGTPVVASGDAVVEMAGQSGGGYGITVLLRHGFGYQTLYAHLSKALVRIGDHVVRGQLIAKSGKTGLVSGPHLHYEVRYNGVCKNPADYFLDDVNPLDYRAQVAAHRDR